MPASGREHKHMRTHQYIPGAAGTSPVSGITRMLGPPHHPHRHKLAHVAHSTKRILDTLQPLAHCSTGIVRPVDSGVVSRRIASSSCNKLPISFVAAIVTCFLPGSWVATCHCETCMICMGRRDRDDRCGLCHVRCMRHASNLRGMLRLVPGCFACAGHRGELRSHCGPSHSK